MLDRDKVTGNDIEKYEKVFDTSKVVEDLLTKKN